MNRRNFFGFLGKFTGAVAAAPVIANELGKQTVFGSLPAGDGDPIPGVAQVFETSPPTPVFTMWPRHIDLERDTKWIEYEE